MNWVVDESYLDKVHYDDKDKLFGSFSILIDGKEYKSTHVEGTFIRSEELATVTYACNDVDVVFQYDLGQSSDSMLWTIHMFNRANREIRISDFCIWSSLAYVMYRTTT